MKIMILAASIDEVKYIKGIPKYVIGVGAVSLPYLGQYSFDDVSKLNRFDMYVLVGSCGGLKRKNIFRIATEKDTIYSEPCISVRYKTFAKYLRKLDYDYADQEYFVIKQWALNYGLNFKVMKYIIDYCDRKAMPPGVNHYWRKWQHWYMQKKIERRIYELATGV